MFSGKNVHEQVILFNKTILNISRNFIPNKILICDDKVYPSKNDEIKHELIAKKGCVKHKRNPENLTMPR